MSACRPSSIFSARLLALFALGAAGVSSSAGCGMENALVGGACADGFQLCAGVCVDVRSEVGNCGACGNACLAGQACSAERCGPAPGASALPGPGGASGTSGTGATVGNAPGETSPRYDGGTRNGDAGNGGSLTNDDAGNRVAADGGSPGTNDASSDAAIPDSSSAASPDAALPDASDPDSSSVALPDAGPNDDGSVAACVAPLVRCDGVCTDVPNDAFNCGACGHFCPTYICQSGACVGSLPGQAVLVGHDYASSMESTPQARVLVNTIFGSGSPTVRVLAYQQYAAPDAISSVARILEGYARATHRQIAITSSNDAADIPAKLDPTNFDVLLVLDEPNAPAGVLGSVGATWASSIQSYAMAGGTVVVLDGATAPEMPELVTNAGMFSLTMQTPLPSNTAVVNLAPGDSVGNGVESPYRPTQHSAYFQLSTGAANLITVVFDQTDGAPVVVQRVY